MKKSIILLVSALLSLGITQAANTYEKCPGESQELITTNSGDSYQWYKDGSPISGATKNKYTVTNIQEDATYKCVTTKKGTTTDTGNLITLGGFEFPCDNPKTSETNRLGSNVWYSYLNFDQSGRDIAIGATTTATNANNVKTKYFCKLKPYSGNYLYVCDGANSSSARVWQAGGIKLPKGKYQFSCHVANIDSAYSTHGSNSLAKLKFVIKNDDGEKELLSFTAPTTLGKWEERKATFEATKDYGWCDIYIINYTTDPEGNDFALDEIYFGTEIKGDDTTEEESFNIKLKNCTDTETIDHPLVTECPNQTVTLTCSDKAPTTGITWSTGDTNTKTITVTSSSTVNESNPDKYSCTYEITSNGITTTYTENFSVATKSCTDSNKKEQKVLIGGEVTISSNYAGTKNAEFKWFKIEEDGTKTPVGDGSSSLTFIAEEGVTYECITTLEGGTVVTETRVILVYNDLEEDKYICKGDPVSISAKTKNAQSYKWYFTASNEIIVEEQTLTLTEVTSNVSCICKITASDGVTEITETYNIIVNPLPAFDIEINVANASVNITEGTAPYTLVLDESTTTTIETQSYALENLEEGIHVLFVTDINACKNSQTFNIHIPKLEPMIFFTPNDDGLNDLWLVKGIEEAPNATIMIYDRHSKLLYQCKGSEFKGWDGTYNKHGMVQDDYWYVISVPELDKQLSGHFILKR